MPDKPKVMSKLYDIEAVIKGKIVPPNFEPETLERAVANIAAGGSLVSVAGVRNLKHPDGKSSWGHWARYFLSTTQGGAFDGKGIVLWYESEKGMGTGRAAIFAFCKHEKVLGAGAIPMRGWHPGKCKLCGLDMTVDSGD